MGKLWMLIVPVVRTWINKKLIHVQDHMESQLLPEGFHYRPPLPGALCVTFQKEFLKLGVQEYDLMDSEVP
jgi:hypothetical protein